MARKTWNPGTVLRYGVKCEKIALAQGARPDKTYALIDAQVSAFTDGAGLYRTIRDMARRVMEKPDTAVSPIARIQYYAFAQRLFKRCVKMHAATPELIVEEFKGLNPEMRDDVMEAIIEALMPGLSETPSTST